MDHHSITKARQAEFADVGVTIGLVGDEMDVRRGFFLVFPAIVDNDFVWVCALAEQVRVAHTFGADEFGVRGDAFGYGVACSCFGGKVVGLRGVFGVRNSQLLLVGHQELADYYISDLTSLKNNRRNHK